MFENHTNPFKAFDLELAKLATQQKATLFKTPHFENFHITQLQVSITLLKYRQLEYLRLHLIYNTALWESYCGCSRDTEFNVIIPRVPFVPLEQPRALFSFPRISFLFKDEQRRA